MKREPVTIDVKPEELHREPPRPRSSPRTVSAPHVPVPRSVPLPRPLTVKQMRELRRMGRLAQQPDFWLGLIIQNFWRG